MRISQPVTIKNSRIVLTDTPLDRHLTLGRIATIRGELPYASDFGLNDLLRADTIEGIQDGRVKVVTNSQ